MKKVIFKTGIIFLFMILTGSGCEKDPGEFIERPFFKFSDFGCENVLWRLKPGNTNHYELVTSQQELEEYITSDCVPQINFSKYIAIIGQRSFTTGVSLYSEILEENNNEIVYTVTFLKNIAMVAQGIQYHVVIEKPSGGKNIRVVEVVKDY